LILVWVTAISLEVLEKNMVGARKIFSDALLDFDFVGEGSRRLGWFKLLA
jgi:hypothetical protein